MIKGTTIDPRTGRFVEAIMVDKCCKPECNIEVIRDGWEIDDMPNAVKGWHDGAACCRAHAAYQCGKCGNETNHTYLTKIGRNHLSYRIGDLK